MLVVNKFIAGITPSYLYNSALDTPAYILDWEVCVTGAKIQPQSPSCFLVCGKCFVTNFLVHIFNRWLLLWGVFWDVMQQG